MSQPADESGTIRLDHFLKSRGLASTGGHAKLLIQDEQVSVNGEIETRRRRKLRLGDLIVVGGDEIVVE